MNVLKKIKDLIIPLVLLVSLTPLNTFAADVVRNRFLSYYSPTTFNDTTDLQYRMNCYGYAIGLYKQYYNGSIYKQQPGSFRRSSDAAQVQPGFIPYNPAAAMTDILNKMNYDRIRFANSGYGYSISTYTPDFGSVAQAPAGQRMIALVTGNTDYHYYKQHSDGTWSHKPGATEVSNLSITDRVPLTNANIASKANQGAYANGRLTFLLVTKDSIIDYGHGDHNSSTNEIPTYFTDIAGENLQTASNTSGYKAGYFDFKSDADFFYFNTALSGLGSYNFKIFTTSGVDIDAVIYDSAGNLVASDAALGDVNMITRLLDNSLYYIKLNNYNRTSVPYVLQIGYSN
jgi:hypothetical protein